MQTEFPRNETQPKQATRNVAACAPAAYEASQLSDDDLALIDLRYDQFMAQAELDHLMEDL